MDEREEKIRRRAYEIWLRAGRPEGSPEEQWRQAEHELFDEDEPATTEAAKSDQELDQELDDSFPASDPPSQTQP